MLDYGSLKFKLNLENVKYHFGAIGFEKRNSNSNFIKGFYSKPRTEFKVVIQNLIRILSCALKQRCREFNFKQLLFLITF